MGVEQSDTFIMLKPRSEWRTAHDREGLISAYSAALKDSVPGLQLSWAQPIEMRMDDMLQGVRSDVAAVIYGDDAGALSGISGAADVQAQQTAGQPYLRIIVDRAAIARYGMNVSQVLDEVEALGGRTVGTMVEGAARFDIRVRLSPRDRSDVAHISSLRISDSP